MKERQKVILQILQEQGRISVKDLSEKLGLSMVTTRKALEEMENKMLLKKEHGYATLINSAPIETRVVNWYEEKKAIARAAANLVQPNETIMVESGSSCALFALELIKLKPVTIITNSIFVIDKIKSVPNIKAILLGGDFEPDGVVTTGPVTQLCASEYHVDKFFVGIDGYTEDAAFTNLNHTRNDTIRFMASRANKTIVLSPSAKFGNRSVAKLFSFDEVYTVISDDKLDQQYRDSLARHDIKLILAPLAHIGFDEATVGELTVNMPTNCDLCVAVGTGSINDMTRFFSYRMGRPFFTVATAAPMDGFASSIAAIYFNNMKTTFDAQTPTAIIGDTNMLCNAPYRMIAAGLGDLLGKFTCLCDWKLARLITGEHYCGKIVELVESCAKKVLKDADKAREVILSAIRKTCEKPNVLISLGN